MRIDAIFALVALVMPGTLAQGCTLYVNGELADARDDLVGDGDEGEGEEGEGEAGEGEGEGEGGEGEGEGEAPDPDCEDRERLVVVTNDPEEPLKIFKLTPGSLLPAVPPGFLAPDGALIREDGETAAPIEGAVFDADSGTFFVVDSSRFYAIDGSTLLQVDVRPPERAVAGFGSYHGVTVTDGYVIGIGAGLDALDRNGGVGDPVINLPGGGGFHSGITFVSDGVTYVASNEEFGFVVLATADPAGLPGASQSADDDTRFSNYGGGQARRGLAYDAVTGSLLLGDEDGLIVPKAANGFALPPDTDDWAMPQGSFVTAIGARSGKAYAANGQDLYAVDLTTTPPTTADVATWDDQSTTGIPQAVVVGCQRVILAIGGFGGPTLISYDRETLDPFGGGAELGAIIDAFIVDKDALALEGDD